MRPSGWLATHRHEPYAKEIRHDFAWGLTVERHSVESDVVTEKMVERKPTDEESDLRPTG